MMNLTDANLDGDGSHGCENQNKGGKYSADSVNAQKPDLKMPIVMETPAFREHMLYYHGVMKYRNDIIEGMKQELDSISTLKFRTDRTLELITLLGFSNKVMKKWTKSAVNGIFELLSEFKATAHKLFSELDIEQNNYTAYGEMLKRNKLESESKKDLEQRLLGKERFVFLFNTLRKSWRKHKEIHEKAVANLEKEFLDSCLIYGIRKLAEEPTEKCRSLLDTATGI